MKAWIFVGLLILTAGAAMAQDVSEEHGYDHAGGDYTSFRTRSLEACQSACQRERRCQAYTFQRRDEKCFLKERIYRAVESRDAVTGVKGEEDRRGHRDHDHGDRGDRRGMVEEPGFDRRGDDYTSFRAHSEDGCISACRREDRCRSFTFIYSSGTCYLKGRVNSRVRNDDAITGYKENH